MDFYKEKKILLTQLDKVLNTAKEKNIRVSIPKLIFLLTEKNGGFGTNIIKQRLILLKDERKDFNIEGDEIVFKQKASE